MKRAFIFLILLLLAVAGSVVAYLNAAEVTFNYYFSTFSLPLAALLFLVLTAGALAGVTLSFGMVARSKREKKKLRQRLKVCEQEIKNLRDIPIKGPY